MDRFHFPAWVNTLILPGLGMVALGGAYVSGLIAYGLSPVNLVAGYKPVQPVPFSHALHAGQLKMDCRYCHTHVFESSHSNIPATATCGNCHRGQDAAGNQPTVAVHTESLKLAPVRESLDTGAPIAWNRVHDLPDYAYFNHSAHVNRGVSCVECHGRIDKMEVVERVNPLNMGWCLECHRHPTAHLRPVEFITQLDWKPPAGQTKEDVGAEVAKELKIRSLTDCSTCHR